MDGGLGKGQMEEELVGKEEGKTVVRMLKKTELYILLIFKYIIHVCLPRDTFRIYYSHLT